MNDFAALPPAPGFSSGGPGPSPDESPLEVFQRMHRLLRGRYIYAVLFGVVGAIAGAVGGYMVTVPKYQSVGMIRVKAPPQKVYKVEDNGNQGIQSVAQSLQIPRVIDKAMLSPEWKAVGRGLTDDAKDEFRESLRVDVGPGNSEWVYVRFTDKDPKAAQIAVEQIINAYVLICGP